MWYMHSQFSSYPATRFFLNPLIQHFLVDTKKSVKPIKSLFLPKLFSPNSIAIFYLIYTNFPTHELPRTYCTYSIYIALAICHQYDYLSELAKNCLTKALITLGQVRSIKINKTRF